MFRHLQDTEPGSEISQLGRILSPLRISTRGPSSLGYLGVPIVIGLPMIVVQDEDLDSGTRKLVESGFTPSAPNRNPAPEILAEYPDPQAVLREVNEGYERVDSICKTFDSPSHLMNGFQQVLLIPGSFANLPIVADAMPNSFESLIRAVIDEETSAGFASWAASIEAWISMMVGYLGLENDVLDDCSNEKVVPWCSTRFGRLYESKNGPFDRRISKRLGSGKELPVDMSGSDPWTALTPQWQKPVFENNLQSLSIGSIYYQTLGPLRLLAIFRQHIVLYSRVNSEDAVQKKRGREEEKRKETY